MDKEQLLFLPLNNKHTRSADPLNYILLIFEMGAK